VAKNALAPWPWSSALAAAALAVLTSACGGGWSPPQRVGDMTPDASGLVLAVAGNGHAVAAWAQADGAARTAFARELVPGQGWGPLETLGGSRRSLYGPLVAMDASGNAIATWTGYDDREAHAEVRRWRPGAGWSAAETLPTVSGSAVVAMSRGGDAALVWSESNRLFVRVDARGSPGVPRQIDRGTGDSLAPVGAGLTEDGTVVAVWAENHLTVPAHGLQVLVARVLTAGGGLGALAVVGGGWFVETSNLSVSPRGDALLLRQGVSAARGPVHAESLLRLGGWTTDSVEPQTYRVGRTGLDAQGRGWIVFPEAGIDSGEEPNTLAARRWMESAGWAPPETIARSGTAIAALDLAVAPDGTGVMVWTANVGAKRALLASRSAPGREWGPPEAIVEPEGTACVPGQGFPRSPRVGLDDAGNATVVWIAPDCSTGSVALWTSRSSHPVR
jgi:hypothetical protein